MKKAYIDSVTFGGKFSTTHVFANANIPSDEMNMTDDKQTTGNQM